LLFLINIFACCYVITVLFAFCHHMAFYRSSRCLIVIVLVTYFRYSFFPLLLQFLSLFSLLSFFVAFHILYYILYSLLPLFTFSSLFFTIIFE